MKKNPESFKAFLCVVNFILIIFKMKTKKNNIELSTELLRTELRERFTIKWLKQFKGFEKVDNKKANLIIESMIELTILLTCSVLDNT